MEEAKSWGRLEFTLEEYMQKHNVSRNGLASAARLQYTQLLTYCRNEVQRPDIGVLARICTALQCDISDIMRFIPPSKKK